MYSREKLPCSNYDSLSSVGLVSVPDPNQPQCRSLLVLHTLYWKWYDSNELQHYEPSSFIILPSLHQTHSLVSRPLPDFISQPWRKIGRRPGIIDMSRTGNGGLGQYKPGPCYVLPESTISGPWRINDPRPSPDFSPRLWDKIWEWPGEEAIRHISCCLVLQINIHT